MHDKRRSLSAICGRDRLLPGSDRCMCRKNGNIQRTGQKNVCLLWGWNDVRGNLLFGHSEENDCDQKDIMAGKTAEFKKRFLEKYPSDMCREILGNDISKPGEMDKVLEKGLMFELCPQIVIDVLSILEELI